MTWWWVWGQGSAYILCGGSVTNDACMEDYFGNEIVSIAGNLFSSLITQTINKSTHLVCMRTVLLNSLGYNVHLPNRIDFATGNIEWWFVKCNRAFSTYLRRETNACPGISPHIKDTSGDIPGDILGISYEIQACRHQNSDEDLLLHQPGANICSGSFPYSDFGWRPHKV